MTTQTVKRKYLKPAMRVYRLREPVRLLQMSGRDGYTPDNTNPFAG